MNRITWFVAAHRDDSSLPAARTCYARFRATANWHGHLLPWAAGGSSRIRPVSLRWPWGRLGDKIEAPQEKYHYILVAWTVVRRRGVRHGSANISNLQAEMPDRPPWRSPYASSAGGERVRMHASAAIGVDASQRLPRKPAREFFVLTKPCRPWSASPSCRGSSLLPKLMPPRSVASAALIPRLRTGGAGRQLHRGQALAGPATQRLLRRTANFIELRHDGRLATPQGLIFLGPGVISCLRCHKGTRSLLSTSRPALVRLLA